MRINNVKRTPKILNSELVCTFLVKNKKFCFSLIEIYKYKSVLNIKNWLTSSIFICNSSLSTPRANHFDHFFKDKRIFFKRGCRRAATFQSHRINFIKTALFSINLTSPFFLETSRSCFTSTFFGWSSFISFKKVAKRSKKESLVVTSQTNKASSPRNRDTTKAAHRLFRSLKISSRKKTLFKFLPPLENKAVIKVYRRESGVSTRINTTETKKKFFSRNFDKNRLKKFVIWFSNKWGLIKTLELLETLKLLGFKYAQLSGLSLNIEDLYIPDEKEFLVDFNDFSLLEQEFKVFQKSNDPTNYSVKFISTWTVINQLLRNAFLQYFKTGINRVNPSVKTHLTVTKDKDINREQKTKNYTGSDSLYIMAFSGARGNMSQVSQLTLMRGLMSDPLGNLVEFPIISNVRVGR